MSDMKRGKDEADTARLNGWGVGTLVRGHEEWADGRGVWTTWRITAIGEDAVLAKAVRSEYTGLERPPHEHEHDQRRQRDHTVTFALREWAEVRP